MNNESFLTSPDDADKRIIRFVDPALLRIDPEVQRSRRDLRNPAEWDATIRKIIEHGWDPNLAGAVEITEQDGHLYAHKGQGRVISAVTLGVESVLTIQVPYTRKTDIANSSLTEVETTRPHDAWDKFQLAIAAERDEDQAMVGIASYHGVRIERVSGPSAIAVGACRRIFRQHTKLYPGEGELLNRVLSLSGALYDADRSDKSVARTSDVLHALADIVRMEDACDWTYTPREFALRILAERDLEDWGRKFAASGHKTGVRKVIAVTWKDKWNKARQVKRFPPFAWERDI